MENSMKKLFCLILTLVVAVTCAGCTVSVGNTSDKPNYDDIFTWGNNTNSYSMLTYKIDLQQYGSTTLYLDATFGHSFELFGETNTFAISDSSSVKILDGIYSFRD